MGPSGSGKSTLLHCLAGIFEPGRGEVWFEGQRLDGLGETKRTQLRRTAFGFVFQFGQLVPELSAADNIALPLLLNRVSRKAAYKGAASWLHPSFSTSHCLYVVGLPDWPSASRWPHPYHGSGAKRRASRRLRRSCDTVSAAVMGSLRPEAGPTKLHADKAAVLKAPGARRRSGRTAHPTTRGRPPGRPRPSGQLPAPWGGRSTRLPPRGRSPARRRLTSLGRGGTAHTATRRPTVSTTAVS
jgi:ABC transporter